MAERRKPVFLKKKGGNAFKSFDNLPGLRTVPPSLSETKMKDAARALAKPQFHIKGTSIKVRVTIHIFQLNNWQGDGFVVVEWKRGVKSGISSRALLNNGSASWEGEKFSFPATLFRGDGSVEFEDKDLALKMKMPAPKGRLSTKGKVDVNLSALMPSSSVEGELSAQEIDFSESIVKPSGKQTGATLTFKLVIEPLSDTIVETSRTTVSPMLSRRMPKNPPSPGLLRRGQSFQLLSARSSNGRSGLGRESSYTELFMSSSPSSVRSRPSSRIMAETASAEIMMSPSRGEPIEASPVKLGQSMEDLFWHSAPSDTSGMQHRDQSHNHSKKKKKKSRVQKKKAPEKPSELETSSVDDTIEGTRTRHHHSKTRRRHHRSVSALANKGSTMEDEEEGPSEGARNHRGGRARHERAGASKRHGGGDVDDGDDAGAVDDGVVDVSEGRLRRRKVLSSTSLQRSQVRRSSTRRKESAAAGGSHRTHHQSHHHRRHHHSRNDEAREVRGGSKRRERRGESRDHRGGIGHGRRGGSKERRGRKHRAVEHVDDDEEVYDQHEAEFNRKQHHNDDDVDDVDDGHGDGVKEVDQDGNHRDEVTSSDEDVDEEDKVLGNVEEDEDEVYAEAESLVEADKHARIIDGENRACNEEEKTAAKTRGSGDVIDSDGIVNDDAQAAAIGGGGGGERCEVKKPAIDVGSSPPPSSSSTATSGGKGRGKKKIRTRRRRAPSGAGGGPQAGVAEKVHARKHHHDDGGDDAGENDDRAPMERGERGLVQFFLREVAYSMTPSYSMGIPVCAYITFRFLLQWRAFDSDKEYILSGVLDAIDRQQRRDQRELQQLLHWLSSTCVLLHLLQEELLLKGRVRRGSSALAALEAFQWELRGRKEAYVMAAVQQVMGSLRREELVFQGILGVGKDTKAKATAKDVVAQFETLRLRCVEARVPDEVRRTLFHHCAAAMAAEVANAAFDREEVCRCSKGFAIKMAVCELEEWLSSHKYSEAVDALRVLRQISDVLTIPKMVLADASTRADLCPDLCATQLLHILRCYQPDELDPTPLPDDLLDAIEAEHRMSDSRPVYIRMSDVLSTSGAARFHHHSPPPRDDGGASVVVNDRLSVVSSTDLTCLSVPEFIVAHDGFEFLSDAGRPTASRTEQEAW